LSSLEVIANRTVDGDGADRYGMSPASSSAETSARSRTRTIRLAPIIGRVWHALTIRVAVDLPSRTS
jgi:hypothetical protein